MDKKIIEIVTDCMECKHGQRYNIVKVIGRLIAHRDKGATHVDFYGKANYVGGVEHVGMETIQVREETDDEYNERAHDARVAQEAQAKEVEAQERELYDKLHKKYGHDTPHTP